MAYLAQKGYTPSPGRDRERAGWAETVRHAISEQGSTRLERLQTSAEATEKYLNQLRDRRENFESTHNLENLSASAKLAYDEIKTDVNLALKDLHKIGARINEETARVQRMGNIQRGIDEIRQRIKRR